jgi:uncharacterized protein involved in exopolysaccharide biosynthesis
MAAGSTDGRAQTPRERLLWMRRVMRKRRGLGVGVTFLMLAMTVLATLLVTPKYRASSSLYLRMEDEPPDVLSPDAASRTSRMGAVSPLAVLNSYVETLLSRTTAEQIVRELGLDERPPSTALRDRIKDRAVGAITGTLSSLSRSMAGGVPEAGDKRFREAVADLQSSVAAEVDQDTELVLITVLYPDRHLAQQINQRMMDILRERSVSMSRDDAASAYRAIVAVLPQASERVAAADRELASFKKRNGIVSLSEEQRVRVERLSQLEALHEEAARSTEETRARLGVMEKELAARSQPVTLAAVVDENPAVRQIREDLYQQEAKLAGLRQTYTDDHPDVVRLTAQIAAGHDRLRQEVDRIATTETKGLSPEHAALVQGLVTVESDLVGYTAREKALAAVLSSFRSRLSSLPTKERELEALLREQRVAETLYVSLSQREQQLRDASLNAVPPVSMAVVDPPRLPKGISDIGSPPYLVILILGPIIALLIGLTAVFVAEYFDDTLGVEEEVSGRLQLPVLTSVPHARHVLGPGPNTDRPPARDDDV